VSVARAAVRGGLVAEFAGPVLCRREPGTVGIVLAGTERERGTPLELLFAAPEVADLPAIVSDIDVFELEPGRWRLRAHLGSWTVRARALLLHRPAAEAFFAAVPPPPLRWRTRLLWSALLAVARIPGAVPLLQRLRS